MMRAVAHRGPDGHGTTFLALDSTDASEAPPSENWQIALGHRRLSIIDLSDAGRQPMSYGSQIWTVFNGEIYNYLELRKELKQRGYEFSSDSDTEVLLASYDAWGTECFRRLRGMFGLAIVDGRKRTLVLARDRFGIKPLYWTVCSSLIAVCSEIKQLRSIPDLPLRVNPSVLYSYLLTGYEDEQSTFFADVFPIPAASWLELDLDSGRVRRQERYWFPELVQPTIHDRGEAATSFRENLIDAVRVHLRSDVPVGCSLSGGLDSSAVLACAHSLHERNGDDIHTFSITYPGHRIDERSYIQDVLDAIPASPQYATPTPEEFICDLDRFVWIHDEPVGHFSQYNGYALARLTRAAKVPVILNGQGGDEVLAGYWQSFFAYLWGLIPQGNILRLAGHLIGAGLPHGNRELLLQIPVMFRRYRSRTSRLFDLGLRKDEDDANAELAFGRVDRILKMSDHERRIFELRSLYLPRLLKWDDRNFMAFAVEGRYPFLDHELVEHTLSFSRNVLYSAGWTKEPLRQGMSGMLPSSIVRRRTKLGFEAPQDDWLNGTLAAVLDRWVDEDAPLWEYIERAKAVELLTLVRRVNGRNHEPGEILFRLYLADRWLRVFFGNAENSAGSATLGDACAVARDC
jgi:asparagine synthase (glutamine-hydrolysing)